MSKSSNRNVCTLWNTTLKLFDPCFSPLPFIPIKYVTKLNAHIDENVADKVNEWININIKI